MSTNFSGKTIVTILPIGKFSILTNIGGHSFHFYLIEVSNDALQTQNATCSRDCMFQTLTHQYELQWLSLLCAAYVNRDESKFDA